MKILILGLNYAPEKVGIAVYTTGMAEALVEKGHDVRVVAGRPYYPGWKIMDGHTGWTYKKSTENGVKVTRCPHYVPKNPSGLKRILHHFSFRIWSFFPMLKAALFWKPDIVLAVAPSLIAAPVATFVAKLCGAKTWLHVQDFEVEAAFATGLLKGESSIGRLARGFENKAIQNFDKVSSISPQMCAKLIKEKGVPEDAVYEFRNWADVDVIKPLDRPSKYREEWNITTEHVALYSGNIANKQGIKIIVQAAKQLAHRKDLTFVICGEGPNRKNLRQAAEGLDNIKFFDLQPKENLNELMNLATIHMLPQIKGAADLVLPSKLTNMLASGRPVVATTMGNTGLANEIFKCGIITEPENVAEFVVALEQLLNDKIQYADFAKSARLRAEETWSGSAILNAFECKLSLRHRE
ncbi:WcaI family glycosyltransferase [Hirschia litorea]|uniref:WcaI family glycosyltransferase n=1 Tax=Hirschia litorea TaxID=1199156 RepID=A0ABW2IP46_9PROT